MRSAYWSPSSVTTRFSEDLDFSLLPDAAYSDEALRQVLTEIARSASEVSGIEFPSQYVVVQPRQDKQGRLTFEAATLEGAG